MRDSHNLIFLWDPDINVALNFYILQPDQHL